MANVTHWTERSAKDFLYSIASDFIEQLQERMEAIPMKQSELARAAKVSKGYVSKMFKNPGNLSLETIVKFARIVGMKVSIVGYVDINDPANSRGPISADVFRKTWEDAERPADMWVFNEMRKAQANTLSARAVQEHPEWSLFVFNQTSNAPARTVTGWVARLSYHSIPGKKRTQSVLEVANG